MKRTWIWALGALAAGAAAAAPLAKKEMEARFYYDLGPDTLDVSAYPENQRKNYEVFSKTCSQCHTLARPINSPYSTLADWKRYISRMKGKSENSGVRPITKEQAKTILAFLSYDSNLRKVKGKKDFEAQTASLKAKFDDVKKRKPAEQIEQTRKGVKNAAPFTGDRPSP